MISSAVFTALLFVFTWSMCAGASLINYNEALDGDLDQSDPLFQFDVGINRFSGSMMSSAVPGESDFDSINFSLDDGMELTEISAIIEGGRIDRTEYALDILGYPPGFVGFDEEHLPFSGSMFDEFLPLGSGDYRLRHYVFVSNPDAPVVPQDYTLEFHVVPEPATVVLLGLGGLVWLRRGPKKQ